MSASLSSTRRSSVAGFSMVELVVSILVMVVLTAVAVPSLMRSLRAYQLNQAAGQVSDMLKFTRFEAVRRNTQINFQVTQRGASWIVWTDSFFVGNAGPIDARDKQQTIAGFPSLLSAGTPPPPSAIRAALGGAPLNTLSGTNNTVTFDARGAIRNGVGGQVSNAIYVFYVGNPIDPDSGYRAVVLLPSGSVQMWTAPAVGPWRQVA